METNYVLQVKLVLWLIVIAMKHVRAKFEFFLFFHKTNCKEGTSKHVKTDSNNWLVLGQNLCGNRRQQLAIKHGLVLK